MNKHLEFKDSKSHKFWNIEVAGNTFTVNYGKVDTQGQTKTKEFDSEEKAISEAEKLIAQKIKKGYEEKASESKVLKNDIDAEPVAGEDYYISGHVRFYDNSAVIDGDLNLDFDDEEDEDSPSYFKGIVVEGDLTVKGNVTNFIDDYGKFLEVKGNLTAKNLIIGGSEVKVEKTIAAETFVVQTYNHGEITAEKMQCPILATEETTPEIEDDTAIQLQLHASCGYDGYDVISTIYGYDEDDQRYIEFSELVDEIREGKEKAAHKKLLAYTQEHYPELLVKVSEEVAEPEVSEKLSIVDFLTQHAIKLEINEADLEVNELTAAHISEITLVDISRHALKELPECLVALSQLETLIAVRNKIKKIPDYFEEYKYLKNIDFENNEITSISKGISGLEKLESLNLTSNSIRVIPKSIKKLVELTSLKLTDNKVSVVPDELGALVKLEELSLGGNDISTLSPTFFELVNLTYLDVAAVLEVDFSDIGKLTKLKEISFSRCYLKELPASMSQLGELTKLSLKDNCFSELPEWFGTLSKLEWLDLSLNSLGAIPHQLTSLDKLSYLDMFHCQLTEIPQHISEFKSLKELRIDGNDIESLDGVEFPALEKLYAHNMKLTKLPTSVTDIGSLEYLKLSSNDIKEIPEHVGNLTNLEVFILDGYKGEINKLPASFSKLTKLKELDIHSQKFTEICDVMLSLESLVELDLGWNEIDEIPKGISKLKNLESFSLHNNELTSIPDELLSLKKLKLIMFYENNICDIPENIGDLSELESFDFSDNLIEIIPSSIVKLQNIQRERFLVRDNPISNVPEDVLDEGFSAMQRYFEEKPKKKKGFFGLFKK